MCLEKKKKKKKEEYSWATWRTYASLYHSERLTQAQLPANSSCSRVASLHLVEVGVHDLA